MTCTSLQWNETKRHGRGRMPHFSSKQFFLWRLVFPANYFSFILSWDAGVVRRLVQCCWKQGTWAFRTRSKYFISFELRRRCDDIFNLKKRSSFTNFSCHTFVDITHIFQFIVMCRDLDIYNGICEYITSCNDKLGYIIPRANHCTISSVPRFECFWKFNMSFCCRHLTKLHWIGGT